MELWYVATEISLEIQPDRKMKRCACGRQSLRKPKQTDRVLNASRIAARLEFQREFRVSTDFHTFESLSTCRFSHSFRTKSGKMTKERFLTLKSRGSGQSNVACECVPIRILLKVRGCFGGEV